MPIDLAIRLTEIILACAFIQQTVEHLSIKTAFAPLFFLRLLLCILLITGVQGAWVCLLLLITGLVLLYHFQGPYNGGSDRMGLLTLCCLCLTYWLPTPALQAYAFGYLAIQLVLSYVIAGWVKIINHEWRTGRALQDVFAFSAYPVSEGIREWAQRPQLLVIMSWAVMLFELAFPLTLLTQPSLIIGLIIAGVFHLTNACLFGLNRFFWVWLAAYPSILWLQTQIPFYH